MKRLFLALGALFLLVNASPSETSAWRDDLRFMAAEMEKTHKNLYHTISRGQFAAMVAKLDQAIPKLTRAQIIVEMMKIAAAVGDGHTNINSARDPKIGFRSLPVALYFFDDGLYVRAARSDLGAIVGARVVKIGRSTADDAYARVKPVIARDNEQGVRFWAPAFLVMPEILQATGIVDDAENVVLELENGRTVTLHPSGPFEPLPSDTDVSWIRHEGWIDARGTTDPLWLRDPLQETRMEMLPGSKTLYVQINKIDAGLQPFATELRERIARSDVEKLAVDLRLNRGGHGDYNVFLLRAIIQSMAIDRKGRFFCIIGRSTFSAAQSLIDDFANYTNVMFVGEPSGSKGNQYGDSKKLMLPNSGITVRTSMYYWQHWAPWKKEDATMPDIPAPLTFGDYRRGVDPALAAIGVAGRS
ncbi:MAG: hypothetical protein ACXW3E_04765 [Thermoanaerobaculia bacterium]